MEVYSDSWQKHNGTNVECVMVADLESLHLKYVITEELNWNYTTMHNVNADDAAASAAAAADDDDDDDTDKCYELISIICCTDEKASSCCHPTSSQFQTCCYISERTLLLVHFLCHITTN